MKKQIIGILCILFMYILLFQSVIQSYLSIFRYFDEILALLFFPFIIYYILKNKGKVLINKNNFIIATLLLIIIFIGLISNIKYNYQSAKYVLSDLLVFVKFFLVYFMFNMINKDILKDYTKLIVTNVKIITVVLTILTILNFAFKMFPTIGYRYGIPANELFFGHPTVLSATCVFLMTILLYFDKISKKNLIYIAMLSVVMISTLRAKAIAFVVVSFVILIYVCKFNKKINTSKLLILAILCFAIAYKQIYGYFIEDTTARGVLLTTSFEIANDHFPLGTGFGTYGSFYSGENYSPIYEMYNLNKIHGLSEDRHSFITDSFWPMILGQFGYIGLTLYVICILLIYLRIQKGFSSENKNQYIAKIFALLYLLIISTAETAFVSPLAIPLAIILAM